jgi:hypothetical protein
MRTRTVFAATISLILVIGSADATTRVTQIRIDCGEHIPAVCKAAKIEDPAEREKELYRTLAEALQSPLPYTRAEAFAVLARLEYPPPELPLSPLDPRPLREALIRFDELEGSDRGLGLVERIDLRHASRDQRARIYHRAISEGSAPAGRSFVLPRGLAMERAALEGMADLRPLIQRFCPEEVPGDCGELRYWLASLELREGGLDQADADARAVKRIAALPATELWSKIKSDLPWARVVSEVRSNVCETPESEPCRDIKASLRRIAPLIQAESESMKSKRLAAWDHAKSPYRPDPPSKDEERFNSLLAWVSKE